MMADQLHGKDSISNGVHKENKPVQGNRPRGEMIFTHPSRNKGYQRKPEKQMEVSPENCSVYRPHGVQHVVVIAPVNTYVNEAQDITEKYGAKSPQRAESVCMGHPHFQYHNSNDDGYNAIAEC